MKSIGTQATFGGVLRTQVLQVSVKPMFEAITSRRSTLLNNTKYFKTDKNVVLWCDSESFNPETDGSKEWKIFKRCATEPEAKAITKKMLWNEVVYLLKFLNAEK